ncbi:MAG: PAS domain-containing sensor histidine kinase [Gemmatimonadetes bacterium]|nr:PAS domain-containing sensor histidine kinase [Gemmatimonadota bacterium]
MTSEPERKRKPLSHDVRLFLMALAAGLPAVVVAMVLLWTGQWSARVQWTLSVFMVSSWLGFALVLRAQVVRPLQTISNMLGALQEGDYSIRARQYRDDDALGLAMLEVNTLGETLHRQRLDALEATALLSKVMEEIDVAAFTFDGSATLRLVNRGGERLLGRRSADLIGKTAEELDLAQCLEGETPRLMDHAFTGLGGRWELRRSVFRESGLPHQLVVLSDLTRALRHEERQAWQRLVQVLRHEINNSLAPIQSLAGTMRRILTRNPRPPDWEKDLGQGLSIITERSGALSRFMASYAKLTHLPKPRLGQLDVATWVNRVARLETRIPVAVLHGPELTIAADGDQLDQLLINLVRNAADAALETGGGVRVGWAAGRGADGYVEIWVQDDGPGLSNTDNLFVPFFTTKPQGSGIGLVLSRQIAEAHGGNLMLVNRESASGCEARLRLPV